MTQTTPNSSPQLHQNPNLSKKAKLSLRRKLIKKKSRSKISVVAGDVAEAEEIEVMIGEIIEEVTEEKAKVKEEVKEEEKEEEIDHLGMENLKAEVEEAGDRTLTNTKKSTISSKLTLAST